MQNVASIDPAHPYAALPKVWQGSFDPPDLADPEDPHWVQRSHLNKNDVGKSSGSCKAFLVMRLHRRAVLQEFWCESHEEMLVNTCIAGHPMVVGIKEQFTRTPFVDLNDKRTHMRMDSHVLLKDGSEVLFSIKYDSKARSDAYLTEAQNIAAQCRSDVADRLVVASRFTFHPVHRKNAELILHVRRGWDPEADKITLETAQRLGGPFTLGQLIGAAQLGDRGYRAAVRLIGDGDLGKKLLDRIDDDLMCWSVSA